MTHPNITRFSGGRRTIRKRPARLCYPCFSERTKYFEPSRSSFMINFRVANLDRLLAQLRQEGVKVDDKIDDEPNGRFGWAKDPDGNRIELWEPRGE